MINKVEICGVDTSRLPVIPESRLKEYFDKIYAGDRNAREEFIQGNLRLVLSIVQRFSTRGENMDDLFQIGCVGLIKAIDNFDISVGVRFSTYACPMIIGEIRRYLRDNSLMRVSRSLKDTAYRAFAISRELAERNAQEPGIDAIAKEMGISREELSFALDAVHALFLGTLPRYSWSNLADGHLLLPLLQRMADRGACLLYTSRCV